MFNNVWLRPVSSFLPDGSYAHTRSISLGSADPAPMQQLHPCVDLYLLNRKMAISKDHEVVRCGIYYINYNGSRRHNKSI
jgi:hypothetical protein